MTRRSRVVLSALFACLALAGHSWAGNATKLRAVPPIYADSKGGQLRSPEAVACGEGSRLVVGDAGNGRFVAYKVAGDRVNPTGEMTIAELPFPIRIDISSNGELVVLDGKTRRIGWVSATGEFLRFISIDAPGPLIPRSIDIDRSDRLHVLDVGGGRVLVVDAAGKVTRSVPLPETQPSFFADLAVDSRGNIFLLDTVGRQVWVVAPEATVATPFGDNLGADLDFATSLTVDEAGRLYLADQNGGGIVILGTDGTFRGRHGTPGFREGMLRAPVDIAADGQGRIFVADRGNNRVQPFVVQD